MPEKKVAANARAAPLDYQHVEMPNLNNARIGLAVQADELTKEELVSRAAEIGIDLSRYDTRDEMIAALRGMT